MHRITISMFEDNPNQGESTRQPLTPQQHQQQHISPTNITSPYPQTTSFDNVPPNTPNSEVLNNVMESLRQVKIDTNNAQYMDTSTLSSPFNEINLVGNSTSSPILNWNQGNYFNPQSSTWTSSSNDLLSMYQPTFTQQNIHANIIHTDQSFNHQNMALNDPSSSSSSLSNNVNNINHDANNLFSLLDTHRKVLLFDNMVENELSRMSYRSNSMNLDSNALIDFGGEKDKNRNQNTQNQTSQNQIQQLSNICDNSYPSDAQSQISEILNISQAIQTLSNMSPSAQEQLSQIIWNEILKNSSTNGSSNIVELGSNNGNNGNIAQITNNDSSYRIIDSFDEDDSMKDKSSSMQISQHVQALTLHQMDEDTSPTTPISNLGGTPRSKFKKFNSHPMINSNGRYTIDYQGNAMYNTIHQQGSMLLSSPTPQFSNMDQVETPLNSFPQSTSQNLILESLSSRRSSVFQDTTTPSNNVDCINSSQPTITTSIISPKGNPKRFENNPQQVTTPNSIDDGSINIKLNAIATQQQRRRISSSSSLSRITTPPPAFDGTDTGTTNNMLKAKGNNQESSFPSAQQAQGNINFSLPGESESAAKFSKNNQSKKYSNNIFSESGLSFSAGVVHNISQQQHSSSTTIPASSSNNSNPLDSVLNIHHQNNFSSHSSPLKENSSTPLSVVNHNISTEDNTSVTYSTNTANKLLSTSNFHNPPELKPSLESNSETITQQQYLNNISTDYTMSSHSPISSSNSNEQNGQNKQYQGVMPLEGNQSTWGVKVNRKYRQLRKSLKTCKHFEDNYFVLELNGQGNTGNPGPQQQQQQQQPPKPKAKPKAKVHVNHDDKKPSIPIPYKEQVNLMGEFSVSKSTEDEVLPLSVLNRSEESDLYLTTPNSTSSASSKSSSAKDLTKKKRKNAGQEPTRKNRKKDLEQEVVLGGLDSTLTYTPEILPSINMTVNLAPMQTIPSLNHSDIMNFNKVSPYQHHIHQQIPSLISPQKPLDYHPITPNLINYENTASSPNIINFENNTSSSNNQINQTESRNPFSSGFPSNNSFGLFSSTTEDFATMKLPSNNSIDSFFKADLTDEKALPRNMSSSSDFLPLEETMHHPPVVHPSHPIIPTQVKVIPPKIEIKQPKKENEKNQLTRCMSHASLSMLDEEEEEEPVPIVNNISIPSLSAASQDTIPKVPSMDDIKNKSPLITPLNAVLYKNISVSNMDLVKLDVPSASRLRPIQSESEMERDHSHWINEIKTLPSNHSLANMVDFDILSSETKRH